MSLTISHFYKKILHFSVNFSRKHFNFYWVQRILGKMQRMKALDLIVKAKKLPTRIQRKRLSGET